MKCIDAYKILNTKHLLEYTLFGITLLHCFIWC